VESTTEVRLVATDEALEFLRERGGQLYVWTRTHRCCHGGLTVVESATEPPGEAGFRRVASDGVDVYVPDALHRLPSELHLTLHRFPRRHVRAYWNGCAWVA
jgi:hypothetical protein